MIYRHSQKDSGGNAVNKIAVVFALQKEIGKMVVLHTKDERTPFHFRVLEISEKFVRGYDSERMNRTIKIENILAVQN